MKIYFHLDNSATIRGITPEIRQELVALETRINSPKQEQPKPAEEKQPKAEQKTKRTAKG